jgi:hypothetical protein
MTGTEESSSGGTAQTTEGPGTETGSTGADTSDSGSDSGSGSTGAGVCEANGQMECEEMEGCVFLNGGCIAIDSIECAKAGNENICMLLPHCMWDARGNACVDI